MALTISNNQQGTPEWYNDRLGCFTSSEIYKLIGDLKTPEAKKYGIPVSGITYVRDIAWQVITGRPKEISSSAATEWGKYWESTAANWYQHIKGIECEQVGFAKLSDRYGGSADRVTRKSDGSYLRVQEIKCPYNGGNHIDHLMTNSHIDRIGHFKSNFKEYYWQSISNGHIFDVNYTDFISFDPRFPDNNPAALYILSIPIDDKEVNLLNDRLPKATELLNSIIETVEKYESNGQKSNNII